MLGMLKIKFGTQQTEIRSDTFRTKLLLGQSDKLEERVVYSDRGYSDLGKMYLSGFICTVLQIQLSSELTQKEVHIGTPDTGLHICM